MKYVGGDGPSSARLVLIGEAPGANEEDQGKPFVGPSGRIVNDLLKECGLSREEVYVTNVCKIRPPGNNIHLLHQLGKSIDDFMPQLWEEIDSIRPNAVLGFGNTALQYLTGHRGIEKWRGSLLQTRHGYPKFIGTIHPASLLHSETDGKMRGWKDLVTIRWDVERAVRESQTRELELPRRDLRVARSSLDVFRFIESGYRAGSPVSVDIETFRTIPICVGLAFNSYQALSIPLFDETHIGRDQRLHIWNAVAELLGDIKVPKIGQNFKFDETQLETCLDRTFDTGLRVRGFWFDTMLAFRVLYSELPSSLQFITSVLTDEPYYKDEGKEYNPKKDPLDRLLLYNAKDAVVTYEVYEKELQELKERGLEEFFFTKQMPLHQFYSDLEKRGIRRDESVRAVLKKKYTERRDKIDSDLEALTGMKVNVNSPKQVSLLLYGTMGMPTRDGTDEKALDSLLLNVAKDPLKKSTIELIKEGRKVRKTIGTYIDAKTHPDGRIRTGYRIILETGRTSTQVLKPPVTTEPLSQSIAKWAKTYDLCSFQIRVTFSLNQTSPKQRPELLHFLLEMTDYSDFSSMKSTYIELQHPGSKITLRTNFSEDFLQNHPMMLQSKLMRSFVGESRNDPDN